MLNLADGPDPEQCLDIYMPEDPSPRPCSSLSMAVAGASATRPSTRRWEPACEGLVSMFVNYRLSPAVQHPAHAQDVAQAIAG